MNIKVKRRFDEQYNLTISRGEDGQRKARSKVGRWNNERTTPFFVLEHGGDVNGYPWQLALMSSYA